MAAKKEHADEEDVKVICRNRRAYHQYDIHDKLECGIALVGTEVKSLRERAANLEDAYAKITGSELWLLGCDIPEYSMGNKQNHKPKRPRKLLLRRREIAKFAGKATQRGFTLVPLRMYFKHGLAKVEIAVARGKQQHDKRQTLKEADAKRAMQRAVGRKQ